MSGSTATPNHAVGQIVPIHQTIINKENVYTVNAEELHSALNVGCVFRSWINRRIEECGFVGGEDYLMTEVDRQLPSGTKHKKEYMITLDTAKHLAMMEKNETGHQVRQGFIDYEKQTRNQVTAPQLPALPQSPMEMFLLAADAIKDLNSRTLLIESRTAQIEDVALEAVQKSEQAVTTLDDYLATRPLSHTQCYEIRFATERKKKQLAEKYSIPAGGTVYAGLYSFLKHHFKVNTYTGIPSARFEEALMIINNITLDQLSDNVKNAVPKAKKGGAK